MLVWDRPVSRAGWWRWWWWEPESGATALPPRGRRLACVVWGAGRHSGVCGPCWWAKRAQNLSQAAPSCVHEGGDILNELCSPPVPFIVLFVCRYAGDGLAVPRPAEAPVRRRSFIHACYDWAAFSLRHCFSSSSPCEGEEGAVLRHTGFVHLLTAVEYCKYVYKSSGGFQRDSKGFVSQTCLPCGFFLLLCACSRRAL